MPIISADIVSTLVTGIVLFLIGWFGNVFSDRLSQKRHAYYESELEQLRSELAQLKENEIDLLLRRRKVYEDLAYSMNVFLSGTISDVEEQKRQFIKAYNSSMLWASDAVIEALNDFLDINLHLPTYGQVEAQELQKKAYETCLLEMRRDSGFSKTEASYRFIIA